LQRRLEIEHENFLLDYDIIFIIVKVYTLERDRLDGGTQEFLDIGGGICVFRPAKRGRS
jgi:hypothetical protein